MQQGVQVRVVAMHSPRAATHEFMEGVEVFRPRYWWPEDHEILRKEGSGGLPIAWRKYPWGRWQVLPFFFRHMWTIARCARDCDLIHAHWTLSGAAACLTRIWHRRPIVITVQGSDIFQVAHSRPGGWLTCLLLYLPDRVTALSNALADTTANLGVPRNRIQIIPNGVDTRIFTVLASEHREDIILYVGSLIKRKGVQHLIAAMPEVLRSSPNCRLVAIGDGPELPDLQRMVDELHIGSHVSFLGFQPQEEVRAWMQRARIFVLPSVEEGLGVVLLEALACGTPVVASEVGGIPDVITPDVGVLVPPADAPALAAGIHKILETPGKWAEMSSAARVRAVTYYDWDGIARQYTALYQSMLAKPR